MKWKGAEIVNYHTLEEKQVHGALLSANGKYLNNFVISDRPNQSASPQVAYDSTNDRYLVCWSYDVAGNWSNHDLYGRFILPNGPDPNVSSFPISQETGWHEWKPKLAFKNDSGSFVVTANLYDITMI